jgi:hypothetical protein
MQDGVVRHAQRCPCILAPPSESAGTTSLATRALTSFFGTLLGLLGMG